MKKPTAHTKQTTGQDTQADSISTAQNLSKYQSKVLARTQQAGAELGFTMSVEAGRIFVISQYGLKRQVPSVVAAARYIGGLL